MKRLLSLVLCILILSALCGCNKHETTQPTDTTEPTTTENSANDIYSDLSIVGTWICEDINKDCYFIFEENGDAFAKWGTSTVYGYFDYYKEEDIYDIDVPNFLYNEYEARYDGDTMTLTSEDSSYAFTKATMPEIIIKTPDNLAVDNGLLGNWQSADSYECYEFRGDATATITDLYNYATIECKFSCDKGVVTFYYMSSDTKDGKRECEYSFNGDKLVLSGYTYENVTGQTS